MRLALAINEAVAQRRLTQEKASVVLGVNQPKISALSKYRLDGFSVERLIRFLTLLDRDVEIVVRRKARRERGGRVVVTAA